MIKTDGAPTIAWKDPPRIGAKPKRPDASELKKLSLDRARAQGC